MTNPIKKLLREPLFHFLLLGIAIFAAYGLLSKPAGNEAGKIVITQGELASIREGYINTWQRPPTNEEMEGLVRERVREEVYYQEALALGLDKDDIIIRRRLQQKMEFIAHDIAKQAEPTEAELSEFLAKHPDLFIIEAHFSFRQIYLDSGQRGITLKKEVPGLLSDLNKPGNKISFQKLGDASLLPSEMHNASATEVIGQFGKEFAKKLTKLAVGRWIGPVKSAYGLHLVLLNERKDGGLPSLADVHDAVVREFENARLLAANEKFYQALLKNYSVRIEKQELAVANK
ncbi:MAG: peptidyl-prolyl cis-trans isomerase [Chitinophagales bacterium]